MKSWKENPFPTLGVEQEFHLVDTDTADLVPASMRVREKLPKPWQDAACDELFTAILEMRSPVCRSASELLESVVKTRQVLAGAAGPLGVRCVAAGSHPFADWRQLESVDSEHYRWVLAENVILARRMMSFGLHVHVGLRSAEAALYVQNQLIRWLYPLLALSVNSPVFDGEQTGLASTRAHLFGSMPRTGLPPRLTSMAELTAVFDKLVEAGDITAPGDLWWVVRVQPPLGTLEIRVFDLPTDPRRIAALAAVTQALAAVTQDRFFANQPEENINRDSVEENRWKAMRFGLEAKIIEPVTGEVLEMRDQLRRLINLVRDKAAELGSQAELAFAEEMIDSPTESRLQLDYLAGHDNDLKGLELHLADLTSGGTGD